MPSDTLTTGAAPAAGFQPLAPLLQSIERQGLDAARLRIAGLDRDRLIDLFGRAFATGKRLAGLLAADELTARGIPPIFRQLHLLKTDYSLNERFDLLVFDLRWLRRWYPLHAKIVRYQRCKTLLTGSDPLFHREAEFAFYAGKRPSWKIVASMSMTERQQWDCVLLRSAPIRKRHEATQAMCDRVFCALRDDLRTVRRTTSFTDDNAQATLSRRHALWLCSRMTKVASPTEIAARYCQLTGSSITRQAAGKQLGKVREVLSKIGMTS